MQGADKQFAPGQQSQFKRPTTANPERKGSNVETDDFEVVGEKPKKPARAPYKKLVNAPSEPGFESG